MRGLLFFSAAIALVAMSAPGVVSRYVDVSQPSGRAATSAAARNATARELRAPAGGGQFEIKAERDGHFYVEAEINFRAVRLMVDTGATVVALRQSDAMEAGIRVVPADFRFPVQTANGTTNAAEIVLDSVVIADIEVEDVRALVLPDEQLSISLLGGSFLNGLERYQVADGTLILEN